MVYGRNFEIIIDIFSIMLCILTWWQNFFFKFNLNERYFFSVKDFDPFMDKTYKVYVIYYGYQILIYLALFMHVKNVLYVLKIKKPP